MPHFKFKRRALDAPRITATGLAAVEHALGTDFAFKTQWNFWSSDTNVNAPDLATLLEDAKSVKGLSDFEIVADASECSITVSGGATGCYVEYEAAPQLEMQVVEKVHAIEGVFRQNRRRTAYLPRPLCAAPGVNKLLLSPAIKIGAPGSVQIKPDWNDIFNKSAVNIISYAATLLIGFGFGLVAGFILGR